MSQVTFAKAYKTGVKIAFGTDAGVSPHGDNAKEFRFMHEAGMPVMETLQSATVTNASLLGYEDELGQLKAGFIADLIAVNIHPEKQIESLENVVFVMKEGQVFKQENKEVLRDY
jgi:imidazolonepropionase-like amidohydrolase